MSSVQGFLRTLATTAVLSAAASSSWALCPGCPPQIVPAVTWTMQAEVTPLSSGLYDYEYTVTPVTPDYTHALGTVRLGVANIQSITNIHFATQLWDNAAYSVITPPNGTPGSGAAILSFSGTPSSFAQDYYLEQAFLRAYAGIPGYPEPDQPLKGLSFGFTSSDAPGQIQFDMALSGLIFNSGGEYLMGQAHRISGTTVGPIPEPTTLALALVGLGALFVVRRKR